MAFSHSFLFSHRPIRHGGPGVGQRGSNDPRPRTPFSPPPAREQRAGGASKRILNEQSERFVHFWNQCTRRRTHHRVKASVCRRIEHVVPQHLRPRRMPLGLDVRAVPADAWDIVSDLVAADTLCRVCRGLREVLGRRYVTVSGSPSVEQLETILGTVRAITLSWDQEPPDHSCFAKIMTALGEAPRLKTLTVQTRLQR